MWGALVGVFIYIETLVGNKLDFFADPSTKIYVLMINLLTLGVGIYMGLRDYKLRNDNAISFGRCMFNSIIISAFAAVITAVGSVVYYNYIFPEGKEMVIAESEQFFVQERDTTATTIAEYKEHFIKNYQDTVRVTSQDLPKIKQMAEDTAKAIEDKVKRTRGIFTFSGSVISYTGPFVLIGLFFSILIAAVIANKRA